MHNITARHSLFNMSTISLPQDRENQVFISLKAIQAGEVFLPDSYVYGDCPDAPMTQGSRRPDFAFLLAHPTKGKLMFDLGLRKVNTRPHCTHGYFSLLTLRFESMLRVHRPRRSSPR